MLTTYSSMVYLVAHHENVIKAGLNKDYNFIAEVISVINTEQLCLDEAVQKALKSYS